MLEHIWINPIKNNDLKVYQYGYEECEPNHSFGPALRDHYLIHFISSGKGKFYIENKCFTLAEGEGFLISPGIVTSYCADEADPWTYSWIGFRDQNAEFYLKQAGLNEKNPVFSYGNSENFTDIFSQLKALKQNTLAEQIRMTSYLYMLLALIIENASSLNDGGKAVFGSKDEYIKNAVAYIQTNYSRKLSVKEVSKFIGLNRSYLGTIFKEATGRSLQDYITDFRIDKAKKLLSDISMTVGDVSRSVGYDDPLSFSKLFKKNVGVSPNAYRKDIKLYD